MLARSQKFLCAFYALASRNVQLEFHTSACVLKNDQRFKKKALKDRAGSQLSRAPSRRRLVPTLRGEGNSGTYEVAPRAFKPRNDNARHGRGPKQVHSARKGIKPSDTYQKESTSAGNQGFTRDGLPHIGRASWLKPRRSPVSFRRERRPDGERESLRGKGFFESSHGNNASQRKDFKSNEERAAPPRGFYDKRSFRDQVSNSNRLLRDDTRRSSQSRKGSVSHPPAEFDTSSLEPLNTLPDRFTSPPLLDGLLQSVHHVLGPDTKPTPIQSLSLKHLFTPPAHIPPGEGYANLETPSRSPTWGQFLLASETGSGKSIAYLLPMIQYLRLTEDSPAPLPPSAPPPHSRSMNPRGLILAPTHELSRQLSSFAKALLHNVRLRVLCTSRANNSSSSRGRNSTASQLKRELNDTDFGMTGAAHIIRGNRPVDVLVGTPMKVLEMARGWGWDKERKIEEEWDDARKERARAWIPGPPEVGLSSIEWVVVDEADILFDQDFQESTRMLLADIAQCRGYIHPSFASHKISPGTPLALTKTFSEPIMYPFHLLLTSATIPSSLAAYLTANHPTLTRLASPNLHHLPSTLKTEHHAWTSGNKNSDVVKSIQRVWAEDACTRSKTKSKILIFCNKSSKVEDLGLYLTEKGIPNVALTRSGQARHHGSNRHLAGFLKTTHEASSLSLSAPPTSPTHLPASSSGSSSDSHIMITTSLLSRGLDFSPEIKHVFILDEPRNMIDFLHRAGRTGRAGHGGKVVVFGKMKGRGSGNTRDVKKRVSALTG